MLLKFSKHLQLSIWSSSTRINCQLLPLILVVSAFEVSLATVSSAADNSSSPTSVPSSSGHFYFSISPLINSSLYGAKLYYICYLFWSFLSRWDSLFNRVDFVLFVVSTFLYCIVDFVNFRDFFCLCWNSNQTVFIGCFNPPNDFKYQQQKLRCLCIDH